MALTAIGSLCYWKGQVWSHSETVQKLSWGHQEPPGGMSSPLSRKDSWHQTEYSDLEAYASTVMILAGLLGHPHCSEGLVVLAT